MKKDYKKMLQAKMLEMIKYIDEICRTNNIEYYLLYGSALGAVRHKGFIPWDDDFDIGMTYENYKKFVEVCEECLNKEKYFLQSMDSDPNYYLSFMKLRDITTTLVEIDNKDKNIVYGVYIDIFPIVGVPKGKLRKKILEINRAFALSANINVINNKVLSLIFKMILKLVGKKNILKVCMKNCLKYSCNDCYDWCSIFDGDGMSINMTTRDVMGTPKFVKFEDTLLPIPENYDEYLSHIYGDYMKVPSDAQIKAKEHTPYIIDLDHSYQEYMELKHRKR